MDDLEIFDCDQNSPEWFEARLRIVTASCFKEVMAKGEGKTRKKLMYTLAGESLTSHREEGYTNASMERGHRMEADARNLYSVMHDADPVLVGFMKRGRIGASPDALIGDDGLLEIKTKAPHLQLECLEADKLPNEHVAQVQGQLLVSGRQWCDFVSYWPGLPLFCKRIYRDTDYMSKLKSELDQFIIELDAVISRWSRD